MKRPDPLQPITFTPRGYCREGHPILSHTTLGGVGDLTPISIPREQTEVLHRQALEIFTIMANSGRSFADCLAAVLLTGLHWGSAASRDSDGTAAAAACEDMPVPQDCQARAEGIAQKDHPHAQ